MTQLLQNAACGTALILAVAVLRRVLKDRLIPEARLALWGVCLFRLLTPAAPSSVLSLWSLPLLFRAQQAPAAPSPASAPASAYAPQLYTPAQAAPAAPQPVPAISWETVLFAAWLMVGIALAARYVVSWTRTRRAVSHAIPLDRDDPRYASLPACARLREGPMEGAPLTFGALRPTVVLSPGLEGEELACVLAHEGVHASRRDNLWHYVMAVALVIHWWNPAVWLMSRLLRRDIELSCDRAALKKLGADKRADYANALVSMATQEDGPAFCQTFGRKAAEERILSIMKFKKTSILGVILTLALVLAVTVAFASDPVDEESTTRTGESLPIWSTTCDPDDGTLKTITITLDFLEESLAGRVANGSMTQPEADRILALARAAAAADGDDHDDRLTWFFAPDSGLCEDMDIPGRGLCYRNESGGLVPTDPITVVIDYIFPASGEDQPNYVDPGKNVYDEYDVHLPALDENGNPVLDDYDVRLPTFDEDGNPVSLDGGIVGEEFYAYQFVSGSDNAVGGKAAPAPSAEPARGFDNYTIVGMDENGYPVDEQGNSLVFDDNGNLFMKVRMGYGPCIRTDCSISDQHYHKNGEVIYLYSNDPGLLCTRENCHETEYHEHDGLTYKPIRNICTRDGCGDTGVHEHDGVIYKGWTGKSTLPPVPSASPIPTYQEMPETVCPVAGCTIQGEHAHNGVTYACNGAHSGGVCDGNHHTDGTQSTATHHSENHNSSGHHVSSHH